VLTALAVEALEQARPLITEANAEYWISPTQSRPFPLAERRVCLGYAQMKTGHKKKPLHC